MNIHPIRNPYFLENNLAMGTWGLWLLAVENEIALIKFGDF